MREFECSATFDGKKDSQKYELEKRSVITNIKLEPPSSLDLVPNGKMAYYLLAQRKQALNLTCTATVGCIDVNYDIQFGSSTSDAYRVHENPVNRTECLKNYNANVHFSKTLVVDRLMHNESVFQCEIIFGNDLSVPSANLTVIFSGTHNLKREIFDSAFFLFNIVKFENR